MRKTYFSLVAEEIVAGRESPNWVRVHNNRNLIAIE